MGSECRGDLRPREYPISPGSRCAGLKFLARFGKDWIARVTFNR
jgi:hypothetical protein